MTQYVYIVEYCDSAGWRNAGWTDDGEPTVFKTREAAHDEIDRVCLMTAESMANYRISRQQI